VDAPVIVSAVRTAVGRAGGALREVPVQALGAAVVAEALRRAQVRPDEVEDVVLGNVLAGGGNLARLVALEAGLPVEVPGMTVDRQCGSGLQALCLAADMARLNPEAVFVAGGAESMTRAPFLLERPTTAYPRRPPRFLSFQLAPDRVGNPPMGITAENVAQRYGVDRETQDRFALESHRRACAAIAAGRFRDEVLPLSVPAGPGGETAVFATDEHPRPDTSLERLARLPPAFLPDGTVTAGNASGINDGAAALVVTSAREAERRGLQPLGRLLGWAVAGCDPNLMGLGPIPAVPKALRRAGVARDELDVIELNEAFASQAIVCIRELGLDPERVNPNGGAIALGHPLGATGAILATKLLYELRRRGGRYGLVTACIGGGQGIAAVFAAA
jgi:acetyl-CoA C-acetyltransferase